MPTELSKAYEPALIEEKWATYWVAEKLFDAPATAVADAAPKAFVQLLPPPNVTGRLHMGHMLNQTEMDVLARWHRMRGQESVWVPGTDHAGIATQMMVEKQLLAEGSSRKEVGRDAFLERVWQWKGQYGGAITEQMRRLGASVDWSREYFTMSPELSEGVTEAFVRLYEQGLIYRGSYIVNWDPVQQTAVSDLEVEHKDVAGKLYHVRYPLADGTGSIVIATTRPETMLGDVAVAVNPSDERYVAMVGKLLTLPLVGREIPVVADDWAKPEFGTGAVKVTPAHDPNDYAIGQRHGLANLTILDEMANVALPGSPYDGMERYAARERIVADLDAAGLLVKVEDHAMSVATSQRSGAVIEPRLSLQWFLKVEGMAEKAIAAVEEGHIKFTPANYAKTYFEWMRNIHDWCISRPLSAVRDDVREPDAADAVRQLRRRGDAAGDGRAGHVVFKRFAAGDGVRMAEAAAGVREVLSDEPAGNGVRYFVLLGGTDDYAGHALYARRADAGRKCAAAERGGAVSRGVHSRAGAGCGPAEDVEDQGERGRSDQDY